MASTRQQFEVEPGVASPEQSGTRRSLVLRSFVDEWSRTELGLGLVAICGGVAACCVTVAAMRSGSSRGSGNSPEPIQDGGSGNAGTLPLTMVIYWTRHALSCANLQASSWGPAEARRKGKSAWPEDDPVLSECGIYLAERAHKMLAQQDIPNLDGVFSSSMLRAMHTAELMFGGPVAPLPYISEVPNGHDRQDYPIADLDEQKASAEKLGLQLNFRWMEEIPQVDRMTPGKGRLQWEYEEAKYPNMSAEDGKRKLAKEGMDQFLSFVRQKLLPTLPRRRQSRIAVASHGTFLALNFRPHENEGLCLDDLDWSPWGKANVNNCMVLAIEYEIKEDTLLPVNCRKVIDGPRKPTDVCQRDFRSCRLDGKPLDVEPGECKCTPEGDAFAF